MTLPLPPRRPSLWRRATPWQILVASLIIAALLIGVAFFVKGLVPAAGSPRSLSNSAYRDDLDRVKTQCGSAATVAMASSQSYRQNGKDYYPQYNGTPGYSVIVDQKTGTAQCFGPATPDGYVLDDN